MDNIRRYKLYIDVVPSQSGPFGTAGQTGATLNNNGLFYKIKHSDGTLHDTAENDFYINLPIYKTNRSYEYVDLKIDDTTHSVERQQFNPYFIEYGFFGTTVRGRIQQGSQLDQDNIKFIVNNRPDFYADVFNGANLTTDQIAFIREKRPDISNGIETGADLNLENIEFIRTNRPDINSGIIDGTHLNAENITFIRTERPDINHAIWNGAVLTQPNIDYLNTQYDLVGLYHSFPDTSGLTQNEFVRQWYDLNYDDFSGATIYENSGGVIRSDSQMRDWFSVSGSTEIDPIALFNSSPTSRVRTEAEIRSWFDSTGINQLDLVSLFESSPTSKQSTDGFVRQWFTDDGIFELPWSDGTVMTDIIAVSPDNELPDISVRDWYDEKGRFEFPWNEGTVNEVTKDDFDKSSTNISNIVSKATFYPIDINS